MYTTNDLQYSIKPAVRQVKRGAARLWRERMTEHAEQWRRIIDLNIVRIEQIDGHAHVTRCIGGNEHTRVWDLVESRKLANAVAAVQDRWYTPVWTDWGSYLRLDVDRARIRGALKHYEHSWDGVDAVQNERVMVGGAS